jgi:hypothetical protein
MVAQLPNLWSIALDWRHIDPEELMRALEAAATDQPLDFRTRLLIRDSLTALQQIWGNDRLAKRMQKSVRQNELQAICDEKLGPAGYSSLVHRIMEPTRTDTVLQFLRELGQSIETPTSIVVGGSIALMLSGKLSRRTEDIDVVDEVPVSIRSQHALLDELARRYGLRITHFQSHFLPSGWRNRLSTLDSFGRLEVRLVDLYDILLSKVFSNREKDRDDLRVILPQIDKPTLSKRLIDTTAQLRGESDLRGNAEKNWYIIYGEPLPQ